MYEVGEIDEYRRKWLEAGREGVIREAELYKVIRRSEAETEEYIRKQRLLG